MSDKSADWAVLGEREVLRVNHRLAVTLQQVLLPDGRIVDDYLRLEMQPFVGILARTESGLFVMERQYKHGIGRTILTLPAGGIEAGEDAETAARRELLEETGYVGQKWCRLGEYVSLGNSRGPVGTLFVATGCTKVAEPDSGDLEEITVELMTAADAVAAVLHGEVPVGLDATGLLHGMVSLGELKLPA